MVRRAETHTSDQYTAGRTVEDGSHAVTEDHRAARSDHDSASRRKPQYSGQDDVVKNAILFGGGFITILVSLYLFASYPDSWLLFLLYGALALPRHPAWRWSVLGVGLALQWWWIYQMLVLGTTFTQIP